MDRLKETKPMLIRFVGLLAARGPETRHARYPEVPFYPAAIDRQLNDHGDIVPGLGDGGDCWVETM